MDSHRVTVVAMSMIMLRDCTAGCRAAPWEVGSPCATGGLLLSPASLSTGPASRMRGIMSGT